LNTQISRDNAATDLRWGGKFNSTLIRSSLMNTTVKKLLKQETHQ